MVFRNERENLKLGVSEVGQKSGLENNNLTFPVSTIREVQGGPQKSTFQFLIKQILITFDSK